MDYSTPAFRMMYSAYKLNKQGNNIQVWHTPFLIWNQSVHHQLPEFIQTHVCQVSDAIQPSHLLSSPSLPPSIFSNIRVFSSETVHVRHSRWPNCFSISPSNEYSGLISFQTDWLDLLAVQGTLKSLLQHHSSKASILWCSAFFMVQFTHAYMTIGKTIALTWQTFAVKANTPCMFSRLQAGCFS